jgi:peroxiredoxin
MKVYDLADFRGKIVLLEFLQTDCPHCSVAADTLHQVEARYGQQIQIVGVVHAQHDNSVTVGSYITGHKVDYPILLDAGQMMYSYVLNPQIQFPHIYVIDGAGTIRFDYVYDATTRDVFEGKGLFIAIDRLISEKKR